MIKIVISMALTMESSQEFEKTIKNFSKPIDFLPKETVCILQHEYAVTHSDSPQPIIGTFGASPCVILGIYDNKNKIALLAHIDADANVDSLQKVVNMMKSENSIAYIYGGNPNDDYKFNEAIRFVKKNNIQLVNATLIQPSEIASLAINAKTGAIYTPISAIHLDINQEVKLRGKEFNNKVKERIAVAKKNTDLCIQQNKHLWNDKQKLQEMIYKVSLFPLDEVYNGMPLIKKYIGSFTNFFWNNKKLDQENMISTIHITQKKK